MIGHYGAFNPAVVTGILDITSQATQIGGSLLAQRDNRLAQQAMIDSQVRLTEARQRAEISIAQTQAKTRDSMFVVVGLGVVGAVIIGALLILRRRR